MKQSLLQRRTTEHHKKLHSKINHTTTYCILRGRIKGMHAPPVLYLSYSTGRRYLCSLLYLLCTYAYNRLLMAWEGVLYTEYSTPPHAIIITYRMGARKWTQHNSGSQRPIGYHGKNLWEDKKPHCRGKPNNDGLPNSVATEKSVWGGGGGGGLFGTCVSTVAKERWWQIP